MHLPDGSGYRGPSCVTRCNARGRRDEERVAGADEVRMCISVLRCGVASGVSGCGFMLEGGGGCEQSSCFPLCCYLDEEMAPRLEARARRHATASMERWRVATRHNR